MLSMVKNLSITNIISRNFSRAFASVKFNKEHEWFEKVEDNTYKFGVTNYAAEKMGDIILFDLQEIGTDIKKGDELGSIESVKLVSELESSVDCEIVEINNTILDDPYILTNDSEKEGWIYKLKVDSNNIDGLMDESEYLTYINDL